VDKYDFSNDSRTTLGTGLSNSLEGAAGMANTGVAGYIGGGSNDSGNFDTVDKFEFPSDTRSTLGTGLSAARNQLAAFASDV
jgi:hypothetical protein